MKATGSFNKYLSISKEQVFTSEPSISTLKACASRTGSRKARRGRFEEFDIEGLEEVRTQHARNDGTRRRS